MSAPLVPGVRSSDIEIDVGQAGALTTVRLRGELDLVSAAHLTDVLAGLIEAEHTAIDLDLGDLAFCDSSGLNVFVQVHRTLESRGGTLRLNAAQPPVRRVFAVTGLDRVLHVRDE
jgi:anti-anti-sigma factor